MIKKQIEEKAKELAQYYSGESDYKETVGYDCAIQMAQWLLQNILIVKLDNAYNHDLFENHKFTCLVE